MPVLRDIPLIISMSGVLRRLGIADTSKLKPELRILINELLQSVNDQHLLEPAIAYKLHEIVYISQDELHLEGGVVFHGLLLPSVLKSAKKLVALVCTIGPRLEEKATEFSSRKETLLELLIDGIGSAAVDSLVEKACGVVSDLAFSLGFHSSSRVSPGVPGLPISEQWELFKLIDAEEIGVRLNSSGVMFPRKSLSTTIGIGPDMPEWSEIKRCGRCSLKETCPYRIKFELKNDH
jgi:hypothetical protein